MTCANRAGLEVSEAVLESLAAAECTLSADERELGVCVIDIGSHSTDLAVFFEGAVAYTASVPIGGAHFTNDLAIGLQLPMAQAEDLKRQYGNAVVTSVPQLAEVEITTPQGAPATLSIRTMAEILEPRARELMHFLKESLRYGGVVDALGAGCVLTGGGAMLPGMLDVTESQLRVPARIGMPVRLSHMPQELNHPSWAVGIGMVLYAHRTRMTREAEDSSGRLCATGCARCLQRVFETGRGTSGARERDGNERKVDRGLERSATELRLITMKKQIKIEESKGPNGTAHQRSPGNAQRCSRRTTRPERCASSFTTRLCAERGIKVVGVGGGGSNAVNRMIQCAHGRRGVCGRQHRCAGAQAV